VIAALAVAAIAATFAPPLDTPLRYSATELRATRAGEVHVTLRQTLRFAARPDGYETTTIAGDQAADGPEPYRTLIDAMLAPFTGVATRAQLDRQGAITGVVDSAASWTAAREAVGSMLAKLDSEPRLPATMKPVIRARVTALFDQLAPEARDRMMRDAVAALLPPPLPALDVGEARALSIDRNTPAGPAKASGTITLVAADAGTLRYRIETGTDPAATVPAVASLLATLTPQSTEADRARIAATVTALKDMSYVEQTELEIDRATGLIRHAHTDRFARAPDGTHHAIEWDDLVQEP
jgi:hypothetical protein